MPKVENDHKTERPAPYPVPPRASKCLLTWRPRVVRPKKPDGSLMDEERLSGRWVDATIACRTMGGTYHAEDIWIMTRDIHSGPKRLESLRQIQYHFKKAANSCECGNRRHEIFELEEHPHLTIAAPKDEVPEKDGEPDSPPRAAPKEIYGIMDWEKKD